jgi:hypothetical protein
MPGLYRIKQGWSEGEDSAVLGSPDGLKVEISEHSYRELKHPPPFDELEWRDRKIAGIPQR